MLFGTRIIVLHLITITGSDLIGCHFIVFTSYNSLIKYITRNSPKYTSLYIYIYLNVNEYITKNN